jgi:tetratricopeptide (TPR) repeat protein
MTSRRAERLGAILTGAIFALIGVLILLSAYQLQRWDSDIFWALKSGEWIVANRWVPLTDPFSYTFAGRPWVDFTWGFQVTAYLFYALMGWGGLFILQVSITGATFVLIYLNAKLVTSRRLWLVAALLLLVFAGSFPRLFIRPHLLSYLFISAYFLILNTHERTGSKLIYLLFPLQVLWVNFHSSAILGIFITGAYGAGDVIDFFTGRGSDLRMAGSRSRRLVAVSVVLPFFSLINPYGLKLAVFPFIHQGAENSDALKYIAEWTRMPLKGLLFYFWPSPVHLFAFRVTLISVLLAFAANLKRFRARDIILFAGAFYMAAAHVRWVSQFVYFGVPLLGANLGCWLDLRGRGFSGKDTLPGWLKPAAFCLCAVLVFFLVLWFSGMKALGGYGLGIKRSSFPEGTVSFMKKHMVRGNIYNEYVFGGYLIFNNPDVKVFIDGRTPTVYSPYFFWTSRQVFKPGRWERLVAEHSISIALIKLDKPLCSSLYEDKGWVAVSFDDISILYLKRGSGHKHLISKWGFTELNPCSGAAKYELPEKESRLKAIRAEIKGVLGRERGVNFSWPRRLLGLVDTALGAEYMEEAVTELAEAVSIEDNAETNYDLGVALAKLGRPDEAIETFTRAVKKDKKFKDPQLALGLTHYDAGDYGRALEWLDRYIGLAGDGAEHNAYRIRGMSCFNLGRFDCAVNSLKKAAFTTDEKKELADIYYYIGNSFFETGSFDDGVRYYALAIEVEPEYRMVLGELAAGHEEAGRGEEARGILELLKSEL